MADELLANPHEPIATTGDLVESLPPTGPETHGDPSALPDIPGYLVTDELASGGMGRVLAATDRTLDRDVAVKVLLPGMSVAVAAERFVRESKITARLQHPGIPPVHQLGTLADGTPFLAMKLIRGRTLAALLKQRASPTDNLPRFVQVFEQITEAVGFAHSEGIIHRDLKPQNVMVGAFGEVQVMDWGLAKELRSSDCGMRNESNNTSTPSSIPHSELRIPNSHESSPILTPESVPPTSPASYSTPGGADSTVPGQILGTVPYMPPEQARGEIGASMRARMRSRSGPCSAPFSPASRRIAAHNSRCSCARLRRATRPTPSSGSMPAARMRN